MVEETKTTIAKKPERKPYEQKIEAMIQEASSYIPTWKDQKLYINPTRGFFDDTPNRGQSIDHKTMLDSHPRRCNRTLASGMTSGLTSPARPWFQLAVDDPDLMEIQTVKEWLDTTRERMMDVFDRSNIYGILTNIYEELGCFATGAAIILEDPYTVMRGRNFTIGEYWLTIGPDGRVNGLGRKYWLTVAQLVKAFGIENVSSNVKTTYEAADKAGLAKWVAIYHLIEENDTAQPDKLDNGNMPFRSVQWEVGSPQDTYLEISGYREFPIIAPRWGTTTNSDIYGKGSPGWDGLGDSKMLQKMQRKKLLGLDKTIDPPVQKDGLVSGEVDTLPGGVTSSSATVPNAGARPVYQIKIDLDHIDESIGRTQQAISATFYADLFLMLTNMGTLDSRERTAREVAELHEEKLLMLGPVLESIEDELLDPLIDRTFAIMLRAQLIPEPPPELEGHDIKVEYISLLAQAQKSVGTMAIEQVCNFVVQLAAVEPKTLAKIDLFEAIEQYAQMKGIPAKIIRSQEATDAIIKAMQDMQLRQQQAQSGMIGAELAKTLSEAKMGQGNALDAIISAMTGKAMPQPQASKEKQTAGATK